MPKVKTTINPDKEITVSPEEQLDLSRMGLLVEDKKTSAPAGTEEGKKQ